jgi:teichuronic acid biosynthesis glycosyltransferase TuaC
VRPYVLMITNMWPHEGNPSYGIFVCRQIESLRALGLHCEVAFVEGYKSKWEYIRWSLRMLRLNFSRSRPLVVHAHGGETALVARWYFRAPVLVSYCGDDLLGTPRADGRITVSSRLRRMVLRIHARLMTRTITKSAEMESVLPATARRRNDVVPNGVNRALFRPRPRADARQELGWDADEHVVLFAADPAVERKRFWLAEAACRMAEQGIEPIRLRVAKGIPPERMPVVLAAADCLLMTSAIEGSPNIVKESLACDLPVISTEVGDVSELLSAVTPSWICPDDPEALGEATAECLLAGLRSDGRERSEWLGDARIAERILGIYAMLAPGVAAAEASS